MWSFQQQGGCLRAKEGGGRGRKEGGRGRKEGEGKGGGRVGRKEGGRERGKEVRESKIGEVQNLLNW